MNGFVFVSEWQRNLNAPLVPPASKTSVISNGIAPGFHGLFKDKILGGKLTPEVAVYAGSSKRGLLLLPQIIPLIHEAHPDIRFEIYADAYLSQNEAENAAMKEKLRALPTVDHVGAVDQKELPARFARATYLLSPNAYPESFCIVMAEAMAAGLRILSTRRAAIPETTHNFAALMDFADTSNPNWLPDAIKPEAFATFANVEITNWRMSNALQKEAQLQKQIRHAETHYAWAAHADSWRGFLGDL
jgi:glycosyltransferase involved in cell wall biosynthesis